MTVSVLIEEFIAFVELFKGELTSQKHLELSLNRSTYMHLITDKKSIFDIIQKSSGSRERHEMLDTSTIRLAYKEEQIYETGLFHSSYSLADSLKPPGYNKLYTTYYKEGTMTYCQSYR